MSTLKIETREQFEAWLATAEDESDVFNNKGVELEKVCELYDALRPRWVPVSTPPEREDFYLCVIKEADCRYHESVLWCPGSGWDFVKEERITHWMPITLPEES